MPLDFADLLPGFVVDHVELIGKKGIRNGELIRLARQAYDALVTLDRGILFQQNHLGHQLIIVVVRVPDSKPETVKNRSSKVAECLASAKPSEHIELAFGS